ncbi:hypothetical protein NQD34_013077 [Periophthalmus magnuspinnatus]|nr:hypothetical protein NQD34_013077 [Periophthalmus magnuspinnatus]
MALGALLLLMLLLGLFDDVCALPAPSGLFMKSINMRHTLTWLPLEDKCNTTVQYSVQYQGDFERLVLNRTWLNAARCQLTSLCQCDLSLELASDSDYNLRVCAHCGRDRSPWQQLVPPFNRIDTVLLSPRMKLDVLGDSVLVSLEDVPQICFVRVSLWRRGLRDEVQEKVVRLKQVLFDSPPLLEGEEYCVQAQIELPSGPRSSPTAPQCVPIPGPESWSLEKWVTVVFGVLLSAGILCTVVWFSVRGLPQTCLRLFHKVELPHSLHFQEDKDILPQIQKEPQEKVHMLKVVAPPPSAVDLL